MGSGPKGSEGPFWTWGYSLRRSAGVGWIRSPFPTPVVKEKGEQLRRANMTTIRYNLRRETACIIRDGPHTAPLIIELHPGYMLLRQKGHRRKYALDYRSAYLQAVRIEAEAQRKEKLARRKRVAGLLRKGAS